MTNKPSRRSIVAAFAAGGAGLDLLPFVRPVQAAVADDVAFGAAADQDAHLLRLVSLVVAADARRLVFDKEADQAFDRIEAVPIPKALEHRRAIDFPYICFDQGRCATYRSSVDAPWRPIYESPEALSLWAQRWLRGEAASLDPRCFTKVHHARMQDIAAGFQRWDRDRERAEKAAGYDVPAAASRRETEVIDTVLREIALCPARTSKGLAAKVSAAMVARSFFPSDVHELQGMLESPKLDWDKAFMTSICADAERIGERDRSTADRRA